VDILVWLACVWILLTVQVKRWHDRGKPGWMVLINLTGVGILWTFVELGFLRGTRGPNKYGADPSPVPLIEDRFFAYSKTPLPTSCNCGFCLIISGCMVALIVLNVHQFAIVGWSTLVRLSAIAIPVMALVCGIMSRRQACKTAAAKEKKS
jgi:hypothetical protein